MAIVRRDGCAVGGFDELHRIFKLIPRRRAGPL